MKWEEAEEEEGVLNNYEFPQTPSEYVIGNRNCGWSDRQAGGQGISH